MEIAEESWEEKRELNGEEKRELNGEQKEDGTTKIVLPSHLQRAFVNVLKCGIYKELHKKEMLSDAQLSHLLNLAGEDLETKNK